MASLQGLNSFAGGLAQGMQAGSRAALTWAGLQQRKQQMEMQRQQQIQNESWKLMSMGLTMMGKNYPRKTRMQGLQLIHKGASALGGSAEHLLNFDIDLPPFDTLSKKAQPLIKMVSEGKLSLSDGMMQLHELVNDTEADLDDATIVQNALKTAGEEAKRTEETRKRQIAGIKKSLEWEAEEQRKTESAAETKRHNLEMEKLRQLGLDSPDKINSAVIKLQSVARELKIPWEAVVDNSLTPEQAGALNEKLSTMDPFKSIMANMLKMGSGGIDLNE